MDADADVAVGRAFDREGVVEILRVIRVDGNCRDLAEVFAANAIGLGDDLTKRVSFGGDGGREFRAEAVAAQDGEVFGHRRVRDAENFGDRAYGVEVTGVMELVVLKSCVFLIAHSTIMRKFALGPKASLAFDVKIHARRILERPSNISILAPATLAFPSVEAGGRRLCRRTSGGWSTWERGVGVLGRVGLEDFGAGVRPAEAGSRTMISREMRGSSGMTNHCRRLFPIVPVSWVRARLTHFLKNEFFLSLLLLSSNCSEPTAT